MFSGVPSDQIQQRKYWCSPNDADFARISSKRLVVPFIPAELECGLAEFYLFM